MENLRKIRIERKMTQLEVAEKCDLKLPAYNHYETGRREPNLETLKKLASALEVTVDELVGASNGTNDAGRI